MLSPCLCHFHAAEYFCLPPFSPPLSPLFAARLRRFLLILFSRCLFCMLIRHADTLPSQPPFYFSFGYASAADYFQFRASLFRLCRYDAYAMAFSMTPPRHYAATLARRCRCCCRYAIRRYFADADTPPFLSPAAAAMPTPLLIIFRQMLRCFRCHFVIDISLRR